VSAPEASEEDLMSFDVLRMEGDLDLLLYNCCCCEGTAAPSMDTPFDASLGTSFDALPKGPKNPFRTLLLACSSLFACNFHNVL